MGEYHGKHKKTPTQNFVPFTFKREENHLYDEDGNAEHSGPDLLRSAHLLDDVKEKKCVEEAWFPVLCIGSLLL